MQRWVLIFCLLSTKLWALTPLESILLGKVDGKHHENPKDVIEPIFSGIKIDGKKQDLAQLENYKSLLFQSINLQNYCELQKPRIRYQSSWQRSEVKRSYLATLQYIGLETTIKAIGAYAHYFEFTNTEFANLVESLTGNFCSKNLSLISSKGLKSYFLSEFKAKNVSLPDISKNSLFNSKLNRLWSREEIKKREFYYTLELFKSFCSWAGDESNTRLLAPLARHPVLASMVISHLKAPRDIEKKDNKVKVLCQNHICRKKSLKDFVQFFPRSIGTTSISNDLQRLYCEDIRHSDFTFRDQVPQIKKMIDNKTFDEHYLMIGQFVSLLTGIPDFFVRSENFSFAKTFLKTSLESYWDNWSKERLAYLSKDILFESPIKIEVVDRKLFYSKFDKDFRVVFDVNLGEFDRVNQLSGKLGMKFNVVLDAPLVNYIYRNWNSDHPRLHKLREDMLDRLAKNLTSKVEQFKKDLFIPPWQGNMQKLIAKELVEQFINSVALKKKWLQKNKDPIKATVEFNYAPFALKYINYLRKVEKNVSYQSKLTKQ